MTATISPSEDDLKSALLALKVENPSLGVPKIHALLLAAHPEWTVSEKRTRKILQNEGLVHNAGTAGTGTIAGQIYPSSRVINDLDVAKWTTKVDLFSKKYIVVPINE